MRVLRTPDDRFAAPPGFPHTPRYLHVGDTDGGGLRVAVVDEGPADGGTVLLGARTSRREPRTTATPGTSSGSGRRCSTGWNGTVSDLSPDVVAAYDAPFPDDSYKAGARVFPSLVPTGPDDPAAAADRAAWTVLRGWEKPFLTAFSDGDPTTGCGDRVFQRLVPGAQGPPHVTLAGGGHFLQEDVGPELADVVAGFVAATR